jgi:hypothetical protein
MRSEVKKVRLSKKLTCIGKCGIIEGQKLLGKFGETDCNAEMNCLEMVAREERFKFSEV